MTAQAQLVLDARAATGRSVQVIKPFMHSSTRPQAFSANSLGKVTPSLLRPDSRSLSHCCPDSPPRPSCSLPNRAAVPVPITFSSSPLTVGRFSYSAYVSNVHASQDPEPVRSLGATPSAPPHPRFPSPELEYGTSSHSEAKDGMRSAGGRPDLQVKTPSPSPNKSESDLDKLRVGPRSAALPLPAADSAETFGGSLTSALGFWIPLKGFASAIICSGPWFPAVLQLVSSVRKVFFGGS